ncbi:hypothetical protein M405DRAFT_799740 [Rhizopogon salebrosus TDB-379]|nr:hypothetical protein M405DRAFT_799740 [Rhizopogon salebrosus TDB-379]
MPPRSLNGSESSHPDLTPTRILSSKLICYLLGVKKTLVYKVIQLYKHLPASSHHNGQRGRHRVLTINDIAFITAVLRQNPTMYLDELQHELHARRGVYVSVPTLFRTLSRLLYSRKDISTRALERDEERRTIFMNQMKLQKMKELCFDNMAVRE